MAPIDQPTAPANDAVEGLRTLLCGLGTSIRRKVCERRAADGVAALSAVAGTVEADVLYRIDRVGEDAVVEWFADHWPADQPVRIVIEGIEDHVVVTFPRSVRPEDVDWICIIDPIDGTRNLMFDKRAAWVLTGLAPARVGSDGLAERDSPTSNSR